jgi:hypothetical protein
MTNKELRKIMIAIVASGFASEYSTEGIIDRAIAIVDQIERSEDDKRSDAADAAR